MNKNQDPNHQPNFKLRRKVAGAVIGVGLMASGALVDRGIQSVVDRDSDAPVETGTYVVKPGDTAWGIAEKVEANQDGVAGNQDIRPISDDIYNQRTGKFMMPGDLVQLPESADRDPSTPGIDLNK